MAQYALYALDEFRAACLPASWRGGKGDRVFTLDALSPAGLGEPLCTGLERACLETTARPDGPSAPSGPRSHGARRDKAGSCPSTGRSGDAPSGRRPNPLFAREALPLKRKPLPSRKDMAALGNYLSPKFPLYLELCPSAIRATRYGKGVGLRCGSHPLYAPLANTQTNYTMGRKRYRLLPGIARTIVYADALSRR